MDSNQKIEELAGLCHLWGAVRYFHPYLATKNIDWDKALVETIPLVYKAQTPEVYRDAVSHMLSHLHDPQTDIAEKSRNDLSAKDRYDMVLPHQTRVTMRKTQKLNADPIRSVQEDNSYQNMEYPSREYRLLSLFRFWNTIQYFYPYKRLLDEPWDNVLPDLIPKFEKCKNGEDYALAVANAASRIQDTHGLVVSRLLREYFGTHTPAIATLTVDNKSVITHVFDEVSPDVKEKLRMGDVILAVDGETIEQRRNRLTPYISASTPQALAWRLDMLILRGHGDTSAELKVQQTLDKVIDISVLRDHKTLPEEQKRYPTYDVLRSGYGYIDLTQLQLPDVGRAFEVIKDAPAVIFDIRGYPNEVFMELASYLSDKRTPLAQFEYEAPISPDRTRPRRLHFTQFYEPGKKGIYAGNVVVLINEQAISQSEHTSLVIEAVTNGQATFVGSPTSGANGMTKSIVLPGDITVKFTGYEIKHADGSPLQRLGIRPDIEVVPTIAGIRSGRDEVLDRAIEFLQNKEKRKIRSF